MREFLKEKTLKARRKSNKWRTVKEIKNDRLVEMEDNEYEVNHVENYFEELAWAKYLDRKWGIQRDHSKLWTHYPSK